MYKPSGVFNVAAELLNPVYAEVKGVTVKEYPEHGETIFCSFKSYGGTETVVNGVLSVEDTANVETWYRPDIKAGSRLKLGSVSYEVLGTPENVEQRNQLLKFKVRSIAGGA
jgi:head-tail adaptor